MARVRSYTRMGKKGMVRVREYTNSKQSAAAAMKAGHRPYLFNKGMTGRVLAGLGRSGRAVKSMDERLTRAAKKWSFGTKFRSRTGSRWNALGEYHQATLSRTQRHWPQYKLFK